MNFSIVLDIACINNPTMSVEYNVHIMFVCSGFRQHEEGKIRSRKERDKLQKQITELKKALHQETKL